jgi:deoxyribose-phosphate aldolase
MFSKTALAKMIDNTFLRPDAVESDVRRFCEQAVKYHFASAVVFPTWVSKCKKLLKATDVKVATVVAFPFGAISIHCKVCEAKHALAMGASEIDLVMNISAAKSGDWDFVRRDLEEVVTACKMGGLTEDSDEILVKVIIETGYLKREEIERVCKIAEEIGADFVKTSTGFGPRGATVDDIRLIRQVVGREMGIKASGGVRTLEQAVALINAGANRIGTSTGPAIVDAFDQSEIPEDLLR